MSDVSKSLRLLTKTERPWAICSHCLPKISNYEQIAQVTHQKWANCSFFWGNHRFAHFFAKTQWFPQKTNEKIPSPGIPSFLVSDLNESFMVTHFWWETWAICSHHSLKKRKWANHSFFQKTYKKRTMKNILVKFCWVNCLFFVSKRANEQFAQNKRAICSLAHLSWATWANCSHSLICH